MIRCDFHGKYTLPSLLDKLGVIERFEQPGWVLKVGEILDEQKRLYHELGVRPPGSLWIGGNIGFHHGSTYKSGSGRIVCARVFSIMWSGINFFPGFLCAIASGSIKPWAFCDLFNRLYDYEKKSITRYELIILMMQKASCNF